MVSDYKRIAEKNIEKYGTDIDRYGPVLLANLYSDRTHFVYELLQNAEDAKANWVNFYLFKDRLEVRHNGRPFDHNDIQGICGLVEGTKGRDFTQIGKFGIGFKSVYAYSCTPKVYSGSEAFVIENYVRPRGVEKVELKDDETLFVFPFNHNEVFPDEAFKDISERLRKLGSRTLLFLNNIEEIKWDIEGEESGAYVRDSKPQDNNSRKVFIVSKIGNQEDNDEEWLIFDRPVKSENRDASNLKVEVGFEISRENKDAKEAIAPVTGSQLVVFFPTEIETHLKFLIQGPYKTTPARDNIPKEDKWNKELIKETALLVADSISKIKDLGYLDVNFLNILPIVSNENKPIYSVIYEQVKAKLLSDEKLLPTHNDQFTKAGDALLARGKDLTEILDQEDINRLFSKRDWLDTNITYDLTRELRDYLINELKIKEVDFEDFARRVTSEFFESKSDEWMVSFYTRLLEPRQRGLWEKKPYSSKEGILRTKPIIRLEENNSHVAPFDNEGNIWVYLPTKSKSKYHTVKKVLVEDENSLKFLEELGLSKPDLFAEIRKFILPKYQEDEVDIEENEYFEDVEKLLTAFNKIESEEEKRKEFAYQLSAVAFVKSFNLVTGESKFLKPSKVYLNADDLRQYFEGYALAYLVSDNLHSKFGEDKLNPFLKAVGIEDKPRRIEFCPNLTDEEKQELRKNHYHPWHTREIVLKDYELEGLDHFLEQPVTIERSVLVWRFILEHIRLFNSGGVKDFFEGTYRWQYYSVYSQEFDAKFLITLCKRQWLVDKDDNIKGPSEINVSELHGEYIKESPNIDALKKKLRFKPDISEDLPEDYKKILELTKSRSPEEVEKALKLLDEMKSVEQSTRDSIARTNDEDFNYTDEIEQAFNRSQTRKPEDDHISPGPIPDPNIRRERTQEEIKEARSNEPPIMKRFKRVPAKEWERKNNEVRTFLKEQYEGKCQICGYTFTKRNGEPYFEGLYLVSRTKAGWIDHSGNVLCLCANCCANFEHGQVEADADNISGQINNFKCSNEGGLDNAVIKLKLCNKDVELKFSERHILDLQEMLKADKKNS